ncbi:MAG TPA: competence protein ComE [Clostridiales bacterium]|nr:competence protein ComE [Clostridiales bacterium]
MNTRKEKVLICIIIILSFALIGTIYINSNKSTEVIINDSNNAEEKEMNDESKIEKTSVIGVHISGAVKTPGFIWIKEGTRLGEALEYVGGTLIDADLDAVNLSKKLKDEEKVYIPRIGEVEKYHSMDNNNEIYSSKSDKININTAGIAELDSLPGIGEAYAKRIIEYREKNGLFKSIEEIKNVSGIGEKRFEAIKDLITVK